MNPFETYGIDPREGPTAITERFRELVEEAPEHERAAIRAAWEELTLHPLGRVRAALGAHPETRPPMGAPPVEPRSHVSPVELTLAEVAPRPSVVAALGARAEAPPPPTTMPAFEDDPWLVD